MKGAIEGPRGDKVLLVVEQQEQGELLLCSSEGSLSTRKSHDIFSQVAEEDLLSWNLTIAGDAGS